MGFGKARSSIQCPSELVPLGLAGFKCPQLQTDMARLSTDDVGEDMLGLTEGPGITL